MASHEGRDIRQRDLVPPEKLRATAVAVIGVGAIGRQVANLLGSMGAPRITVIDPDTVGVENLAVQGYVPGDIGKLKVEVVRDHIERTNPGGVTVLGIARKYDKFFDPFRTPEDKLAVFCCVDSIADREFIWKHLRAGPNTADMELFVDGRMAAETLRVFSWKKGDPTAAYDSTLFPSEEAFHAPCTGRSTLYSSYVAAGLMVGEFAKWLRNGYLTESQLVNLLASEMTATYAPLPGKKETNLDTAKSSHASAG